MSNYSILMSFYKNDIERYLNGEMTPAERHALEKKALSDPFLADALEGAESVSPNEFTSDVAELNQKISGVRKNRWLWPLRIAASLAGIALVSTVLFFNLIDSEVTLASKQEQTETKTETMDSLAADSILTIDSKNSGDENLLAAAMEETKETKPNAVKPLLRLRESNQTGTSGGASALSTGPAKTITDTIQASGLMAANTKTDSSALIGYFDLISTENEQSEIVVSSPPVQQPTLSTAKGDASESKRKIAISPSPALTVTGQVRDQQGQPLPGVNVMKQGSVVGTVTDAEGKYMLTLSAPNATLVYTFIGFVPQEMRVDKTTDYADVQLMEDATQLSEVVVTGYGEKKTDGEPVVRLAEPIGGRKAYDKYLEDKKIYPQQALDNKVEGKVVVEFTISPTGVISDFNIIRKVGFGCEDEVIRLVQEGPRWNPSYIDNEPVESLVRIKTRFDLPGKK
jgi:TonB family protein